MYFAYLNYSKSILLIRKQGYVIENDNNMIPHLKRKTQLSSCELKTSHFTYKGRFGPIKLV
jgi:hypothetical protein